MSYVKQAEKFLQWIPIVYPSASRGMVRFIDVIVKYCALKNKEIAYFNSIHPYTEKKEKIDPFKLVHQLTQMNYSFGEFRRFEEQELFPELFGED